MSFNLVKLGDQQKAIDSFFCFYSQVLAEHFSTKGYPEIKKPCLVVKIRVSNQL